MRNVHPWPRERFPVVRRDHPDTARSQRKLKSSLHRPPDALGFYPLSRKGALGNSCFRARIPQGFLDSLRSLGMTGGAEVVIPSEERSDKSRNLFRPDSGNQIPWLHLAQRAPKDLSPTVS